MALFLVSECVFLKDSAHSLSSSFPFCSDQWDTGSPPEIPSLFSLNALAPEIYPTAPFPALTLPGMPHRHFCPCRSQERWYMTS